DRHTRSQRPVSDGDGDQDAVCRPRLDPSVFVVTRIRRAYFAGIRRSFLGSDPVTTFLPPLAPYPQTRLRRNRRDPWSRKLVAETVLTAGDLIWPVFVHDEGHKEPILSMPEVFRLPIPALIDAAGEAVGLGIPTVAIFPAVPSALKDPEGSNALDPGNLV